jgi:hypothetical protein
MGTHGSPPTRLLEVPVKWTRPARRPADLQVGPETLFTIPATLEDLGRPDPDAEDLPGLWSKFLPRSRGGAASRSEDHGILSVITEGDLPKSVTDPDEGPPTSSGNPSPLAI